MRVTILLFDHVDLLDVGGPYEVFLTASRLAERDGRDATFVVTTASPDDDTVEAYGGLALQPSARLEDCVGSEIVVVPGAVDIESVAAHPGVRAALSRLTDSAQIVASVCTGAFLLGDAGLLEGRRFTTHWEDVDSLASRLGASTDRARTATWVDTGPVVTAGGLSSGIAMALHLVHRLDSLEMAVRTARQIDYAWHPQAGIDG